MKLYKLHAPFCACRQPPACTKVACHSTMAFVKNNVFPNIRFVLNALGQHMRGIQASKKPKYMSKSQKNLGAALRFRGLLFWKNMLDMFFRNALSTSKKKQLCRIGSLVCTNHVPQGCSANKFHIVVVVLLCTQAIRFCTKHVAWLCCKTLLCSMVFRKQRTCCLCRCCLLFCTNTVLTLCCYAQNIFRLCAAMHKTSSGFVLFCTKHLSALCCSAQNIFRFCVVLHKTSSGLVLFCTKHLPALRCSAQNIFLLSVVLHKTFFCFLLFCRKHFSALCCSAENIFLLSFVLQKTFFCFVLFCRKHFSAFFCSAENIFLLSFVLQKTFFCFLLFCSFFFLLCVVLHKTFFCFVLFCTKHFFCFVLFCTTFFCFVLFCTKHVSASCCWPHSISWLRVVLCKTSLAVRCPAQNKSFPVCVLWGKTVCGSVFFARHLLLCFALRKTAFRFALARHNVFFSLLCNFCFVFCAKSNVPVCF